MEYKNSRTANRRRYKSRYHSPHNYKTKRSQSENRAAILVAVATFLVIASLVLVFTFGDSIYSFVESVIEPPLIAPETTATEPTAEPTLASAPTEAPTEPPTQAVVQSEEFNRLVAAAGVDMTQHSGSQMIFVETSGTSATLYTYEQNGEGLWEEKFAPIQGFTGEGGAAADSTPYDSVTPYGTYKIEYAMGTNYDPGTPLKYYQIYYGMRWVTDPSSVNYNRMVDSDSDVDYSSCQWLHEYTRSYPYAVVFDYNRDPVDRSKGCAKFLHVAYAPTYGGIGIAEYQLYDILMWLNPYLEPTISIF